MKREGLEELDEKY
jgi:hypothetical protein